MRAIVLAARKGGSGKTTLAAHLAVQAHRSGVDPVALVDMDTQRSLTAWWNDRDSPSPGLLDLPGDRLRTEIQRARKAPGLLFVDTPGSRRTPDCFHPAR